jgi:hypothetical protein
MIVVNEQLRVIRDRKQHASAQANITKVYSEVNWVANSRLVPRELFGLKLTNKLVIA